MPKVSLVLKLGFHETPARDPNVLPPLRDKKDSNVFAKNALLWRGDGIGASLDSTQHAATSNGHRETGASLCRVLHIARRVKVKIATHFQFATAKLEVCPNFNFHSLCRLGGSVEVSIGLPTSLGSCCRLG